MTQIGCDLLVYFGIRFRPCLTSDENRIEQATGIRVLSSINLMIFKGPRLTFRSTETFHVEEKHPAFLAVHTSAPQSSGASFWTGVFKDAMEMPPYGGKRYAVWTAAVFLAYTRQRSGFTFFSVIA